MPDGAYARHGFLGLCANAILVLVRAGIEIIGCTMQLFGISIGILVS
jgi:hypothetical protein